MSMYYFGNPNKWGGLFLIAIHFTGKYYICILFQLKIPPFFTFGETQGGACLKAYEVIVML